MLQKIRDRASGPLAYIVVGVIAVVFGVWGIGSYFTPSADPVVASAAGVDITQSQLRNAFNQRYGRLRQMLGDRFDSSQFPPAQIRQSVLQGLIDDAVTRKYAEGAGYRVTDDDLLANIRNNPAFQENGQFSAERYKALLAQAGIQPAEYEARLRQSLIGGQLQQVVGIGAFAAPAEVDALFKQANAQRRIKVLSFAPSAYRDQVSVGDQAIQNYYQAHKQQFQRPARVKLSYVSLNADAQDTGKISDETLRSLYSQHRDDFGMPEKRSAQAIRIPVDGQNDSAARQTVQKLLAQARQQPASASLESLAAGNKNAKYQSIDSKAQSALPEAVGDALFKLKPGELSNPVRADDAWYILRATQVTPAKRPDFNDAVVQNRLKAMAHQQARAKVFHDKSQKLSDLAYQAPNDLKTIANQLNLSIQTTGWISQKGGDQGLGQYPAVRDAAFSDAVLKDKLNSKVINLGDNREIVLRVMDHQPAEPRPLQEVADTIRKQLVAARAQQKARAAAQAAMAKAQQGAALAALAKQAPGATLSSPGWIGRQAPNVDDAVSTAAFAVPLAAADAQGQKGYRITATGDDKIALVAVDGQRIHAAEDAKSTAKQRDQMAQQLRQYNASLEYAALDDYLRDQADVSIKKDSLRDTPTDDGAGE